VPSIQKEEDTGVRVFTRVPKPVSAAFDIMPTSNLSAGAGGVVGQNKVLLFIFYF
jgi:hypothetical protein